MDQMKKLREKKAMSKMHPLERKAKMDVLDHMSKMAEDAMGDRLKGMKKVTVASDSEHGLEEGLDKAHDLLKHLPPALDDSHEDHENFAHTERSEDGSDGSHDYPDADDDHELEADPEAEHEHDEREEGEMMADGGEVEDAHEMMPEEESDEDEDEDMEDVSEKMKEKLRQLRQLRKLHPHLFQK
jgi:hypothetical protein